MRFSPWLRLGLGVVCLLLTRVAAALPSEGLFSKTNLVAWCIVPFDTQKRSPEARAEMLAKAKIRAEAAKVNFESKTEERKAIAVARDERAARRTEEKRLAAIETEKRRKEEEERRKQAEIEAKAQAEREHEERVAAMEALETEQKAKRDARYAARKAQKKKGR